MMKCLITITFKEGMAKEQGLEHWLDVHASLIKKVPGVVKYIQNEKIEAFHGEQRFDCVAELFFADRDAYDTATASPYWNDVVQKDGDNFVNWSLTGGAVVREHHVI